MLTLKKSRRSTHPMISRILLTSFIFILFSSFNSGLVSKESKEKIYVQFDKPRYHAGENIWFKVYLFDAETHEFNTPSNVVYIDLIGSNSQIIETKTIKITEGGGHGDFRLSTNLISGAYSIRAYTNYMRNFDHQYFFKKNIHIEAIKTDEFKKNVSISNEAYAANLDVQFFPEGGYLVQNLMNRVGFKAIDITGNGIEINGVLVDQNTEEIIKFETSHLGLGMFEFTPKPGVAYKALILYNDTPIMTHFPIAKERGVVFNLKENDSSFVINVQSTLPNGLHNYNFEATQRKGNVYSAKIMGTKKKARIIVPKRIASQGIIQFTLLDENNNPLIERLAFSDTKMDEIVTNIIPSKGAFGTRELVELEIALDPSLNPLPKTNMSLAVTTTSVVEPDLFGLDIRSQLLLNSELKGFIEQPGYYFYSNDPKRKKHLDLLMMTQGWRQFIYKDEIEANSTLTFKPEVNLSLTGKVKQKNNKPIATEVSLAYRNLEETAYETVLADANGNFMFKDLDFRDSTLVIIHSKKRAVKKDNKRNKNLRIEMNSFVPPQLNSNQNRFTFNQDENKLSTRPFRQMEYHESLIQLENDRIQLDEIILAQSISIKKESFAKRRELYTNTSYTLDYEIYREAPIGPHALTALQGRIPGVSVIGDKVTVRGYVGKAEPLFLLDGAPVRRETVLATPITEIYFIDVLLGAKAAIYGGKSGNGVIAVYTLRGDEPTTKSPIISRKRSIKFTHPGFSQARIFYTPKYENQKSKKDIFDYRPTVYWNPSVKMDQTGKAKVSFYTSDILSNHRILLEGLSENGQIIQSELILEMKTESK